MGANYFDRVCAVRPHCVSSTYLDSEIGAINNNKASDYTQMIFHLKPPNRLILENNQETL